MMTFSFIYLCRVYLREPIIQRVGGGGYVLVLMDISPRKASYLQIFPITVTRNSSLG